MDKLAVTSLVFKNCYSEASYTLASTGTLLTGLPPDFHGVVSGDYSSLDQKTVTLGELFQKKGYFTGAISGNPNFGKAFRYEKGFTEFIELFKTKPAPLAGDFLVPFRRMLAKTKDRPFFIYLHVREPHDPFDMPPPFLGRFQDAFPEQSAELSETGKTFWNSTVDADDDLPLLRKLYDENLHYGDWAAGEIFKILEENRLEDDTIRIFISDHGEAIGENGQIGHGHVLYQTGLRIPLLLKIPGIGLHVFNQPAITSDLVRTLCWLFDLKFPYLDFSRGKNLFHLPENRRLVARRINIKNYPGYTVIQYPYKLILHFPIEPGGSELYNLADDPLEDNPLTGHRLVRETLGFYLFNHLKNAVRLHPRMLKPALREEDLKSLESLGYL
jgi:arylsulfatase A-like enzyme